MLCSDIVYHLLFVISRRAAVSFDQVYSYRVTSRRYDSRSTAALSLEAKIALPFAEVTNLYPAFLIRSLKWGVCFVTGANLSHWNIIIINFNRFCCKALIHQLQKLIWLQDLITNQAENINLVQFKIIKIIKTVLYKSLLYLLSFMNKIRESTYSCDSNLNFEILTFKRSLYYRNLPFETMGMSPLVESKVSGGSPGYTS